jgi:hypothetical protein
MRLLLGLLFVGCGFSQRAASPGETEVDAAEPDGPNVDAPACAQNAVGACPANYVKVPNNCAYSAGEFCIAKYEMKNVSGVATSQAMGTPWGTITVAQAKAACTALGARYHLITNDEWMATAREIEATPANWSTTTTPFLSKGKTDDCGQCPGNTFCPSAAGNDNQPCTGVNVTGCQDRTSNAFRYNRTHRIGTAVIWDFSGNMFELVDHPATTNATQGAWPGAPVNATSGATFSPALADADYKSANLAHGDVPSYTMGTQQPVQNVGIVYVTSPTDAHNFSRGGDFCGFSGIYALSLLRDSELGINVGFRCAYK